MVKTSWTRVYGNCTQVFIRTFINQFTARDVTITTNRFCAQYTIWIDAGTHDWPRFVFVMWFYLTTFLAQRDRYKIQLITIDTISTQSPRWDVYKSACRYHLASERLSSNSFQACDFVYLVECGCVCACGISLNHVVFRPPDHLSYSSEWKQQNMKTYNYKSCDWVCCFQTANVVSALTKPESFQMIFF